MNKDIENKHNIIIHAVQHNKLDFDIYYFFSNTGNNQL